MHADEAVHADKFGTLLEGGSYAYDPSGVPRADPLLPDPALGVAAGCPGGTSTSTRSRCAPSPPCWAWRSSPPISGRRAFLGTAGAAVAALLAAISPAMVFYSRDYIHETPLVFFSFGALLAAGWYLQEARCRSRPSWRARASG